jgi:hypothetical protein
VRRGQPKGRTEMSGENIDSPRACQLLHAPNPKKTFATVHSLLDTIHARERRTRPDSARASLPGFRAAGTNTCDSRTANQVFPSEIPTSRPLKHVRLLHKHISRLHKRISQSHKRIREAHKWIWRSSKRICDAHKPICAPLKYVWKGHKRVREARKCVCESRKRISQPHKCVWKTDERISTRRNRVRLPQAGKDRRTLSRPFSSDETVDREIVAHST